MNKMSLNSKGFDSMLRTLKKRTGASFEDVLKATAGSILEGAARKTGKSKPAIITAAVKKSLSTRFVSSAGDKIRKARDGSLIFKPKGTGAGRWIRIRSDYKLNAISSKNPAGRTLSAKFKGSVNKALGELRRLQAKIIKDKKTRIAASQKSFLEIMKKLKIPIKSTRGLGAAMKAKIGGNHAQAVSGRIYKNKDDAAILIKSRSQSALNHRAGGIRAFAAAFNGQTKAFATAAAKDLEAYAKKFATKNGFSVK